MAKIGIVIHFQKAYNMTNTNLATKNYKSKYLKSIGASCASEKHCASVNLEMTLFGQKLIKYG